MLEYGIEIGAAWKLKAVSHVLTLCENRRLERFEYYRLAIDAKIALLRKNIDNNKIHIKFLHNFKVKLAVSDFGKKLKQKFRGKQVKTFLVV